MESRALLVDARLMSDDEDHKFRHRGLWILPLLVSVSSKIAIAVLAVCIWTIGVNPKLDSDHKFQFEEAAMLAVAVIAVGSNILEFVAIKSLLLLILYCTDIAALCAVDSALLSFPM